MNIYKNIKLTAGIFVSFFIVITSIIFASSILKDEAITNHLTITKLNARAISKELNQDLFNIEQTIMNISPLLSLNKNELNERLNQVIKSYPQIRSINILKNEKIVYSSNKKNININISETNFYPTPIFEETILKVSTPWIGRDFFDGIDTLSFKGKITENSSTFIPISKKIVIDDIEYKVIINLNNEYFNNRFLTTSNSNGIIYELIRVDGILLASNNRIQMLGNVVSEMNLLEQALKKNEYSGIGFVDNIKYFYSYTLTDNYPISLAIKLDYEKNLTNWDKKVQYFILIIILLLAISMSIALILFYLYRKRRYQEVFYEKSKLIAMNELINNIAHQWRQPLSVISTAASGVLLKKEMGLEDKEDEIKSLESINESTQYLSKTIDNLQNFLDTDKKLELFNIKQTINEAVSLANINSKINIINQTKNNMVYGIKNEFIQVILNILTNANDVLINASLDYKVIFIECFEDKGFIYINIQDNGGGVEEKILKRIFEPYFTTKHQSVGKGMGLYMSAQIIINHMKGDIYIKNKTFNYEGQQYMGACFIIKLPKHI